MAAQARQRGGAGEQRGGEGAEPGEASRSDSRCTAPQLCHAFSTKKASAHRPPRTTSRRGRWRSEARAGARVPRGGGSAHERRGHDRDHGADEHEHELRPRAGGAQRAGREAAAHHAGRERAVGQAHHRPAGRGLAAHALGVDGHVDRARGRAQDEQGGAQGRRRRRQPGERGGRREDRQRGGQGGRAPAVDERPGRAHAGQRARADAQQRDAQLPVVDARVRLHRGQGRAPAPQKAPKAAKPQSTRTRPAMTRPLPARSPVDARR